jgi:hypothetical protein
VAQVLVVIIYAVIFNLGRCVFPADISVVSMYCVRMDFLRVIDIVVVMLWVGLIGLPLDRNRK